MRVTVTGGLGYIGACAVEEISNAGNEVRVLDSLLHSQEDIASHVEGHRSRAHPRRRP